MGWMTREYMFDSWEGQIFLVPHPDQLWDPTSLLPIGAHLYDKAARALLSSQPHLMLKVKKDGSPTSTRISRLTIGCNADLYSFH
jgi:hypothetical protein